MSTERIPGELIDKVVKIRRCAAVVKGGRRFSFSALVIVGDRQGRVAWGYGKANEVPRAVNKAVQDGQRKLAAVCMETCAEAKLLPSSARPLTMMPEMPPAERISAFTSRYLSSSNISLVSGWIMVALHR